MHIYGIKMPLIRPGVDLVALTIERSKSSGNPIQNGDIVVYSAKVVGTSQGRLVDLSKVKPSKKALRISKKYHLDPAFAEVVLKESDEILGGVEYALTTIKKGVLIANGGVDQSNAPLGFAALWPEDPQRSAEEFRGRFRDAGLDVGILIIDSRTLPLRMGNSSVALGVAGLSPVEDLRGRKDLFGRPMKIKRLAVADNLASAAHLVMGETSESIPVAVVRNAPVRYGEGHVIGEAFIPVEECLVMHLMGKGKRLKKKPS
ncbi:MAG: coenzyme F420-0:L-glutamate ligase [Candidatus Verstraetearchaeota archaeon]|nr:coenzyme F420-0:L-glutamate ligase [Candidatus Verstraetearchaeota archaeon]